MHLSAFRSTLTTPSVDIAEIEEPCRHDVQFGGMCASCGKDLTGYVFAEALEDDES